MTKAIAVTISIVVDESPTADEDTETVEEVKEYFINHIPSYRLNFLTGAIEPNTKAVICFYVRHRKPGISSATRRSGGSDWERICTGLMGRMDSLNLLDEGTTIDSCLELQQYVENQKKSNKEAAETMLLRKLIM